MHMRRPQEKKYEVLSPFELKNKLIELSKHDHEKMMLNAGRGNPNWVAITPREGFLQLGHFAMSECERVKIREDFGGSPEKVGIAKRFESFLEENHSVAGISFLKSAYHYVCEDLKVNPDDFMLEMVNGFLGNYYPAPDRMLKHCTRVVQEYLKKEMYAGHLPAEDVEIFATEGGTAAMDYVFNSLMENKLLYKGDKIAIGTPVFTPYLEIPELNDFEFESIYVQQDEDEDWQYPDSEIDKLADPSIKAFFLVNPANPGSVRINEKTLKRIEHIVKHENPNLILLTDDVYGTFVDGGFKSLMAIAPHNTILVYSFSKYFGATGWRQGVIGLHKHNHFDKVIANKSAEEKAELHKRYGSVTLVPEKMKLIERMVADSRLVALHHTAGVSTPQQVQMALFALSTLVDKKEKYKKTAQDIVKKRFKILYDAMGEPVPQDPNHTHYYTTIDIKVMAEKRYGKDFAKHMSEDYEPIDYIVSLAEQESVVLMDGGGFDAPQMSVRVSLANLDDSAYAKIGKAISDVLEGYYQKWKGHK